MKKLSENELSDIEKKVQEYLDIHSHLRTPAGIDVLRQAIKTYYRILELERRLEEIEDFKTRKPILNELAIYTKNWLQMMSTLGLGFTKQQYIGKKSEKVQPPLERLKMLQPPKQ